MTLTNCYGCCSYFTLGNRIVYILSEEKHIRAEWVQPLLDWAADHLAPGMQVKKSSLPSKSFVIVIMIICYCHQPELNPELEVDMSDLHFGSHSSGGHVAVEFLKKGCSDVKVKVAMDLNELLMMIVFPP